MAQSVFRPNEISTKSDKVVLQFTKDFTPVVEEVVEETPEYTGPTADDLRREAEAFKQQWEEEQPKAKGCAFAEGPGKLDGHNDIYYKTDKQHCCLDTTHSSIKNKHHKQCHCTDGNGEITLCNIIICKYRLYGRTETENHEQIKNI